MAHSPDWTQVTDDHVKRAIKEYDRLGPEKFFAEHGFAPTTTYDLVADNRRYPPKAILGTAYELATRHRLASGDFEGGKSGAVKVLRELGRLRCSGEDMTQHPVGTRDEWLAARLELLDAEKEHTRRADEIAKQRRALPWVKIDKEYRFDTDNGSASLSDLFRGRSQLLVYHFMFGPEYTAGCLACSSIADGVNGIENHLANHDVMLWAISRAPLEKLQGYKQRMGWTFPWASSHDSDFNEDFDVVLTEDEERAGTYRYNFRESEVWSPPEEIRGPFDAWAGATGTDWATYARERPGLSAFALEDGAVFHTYSAYARGLDGLWGMYQWLDRTPLGRNESRGNDDPLNWFVRHDEYGDA